MPRTNSAELFGGLEFDGFDLGDFKLRTRFIVMPNLSDWGRVRFNLNTDAQWEIIDDFYFNIGYFQNFDIEPPNDGPKNDYGVTTSVGASHRADGKVRSETRPDMR